MTATEQHYGSCFGSGPAARRSPQPARYVDPEQRLQNAASFLGRASSDLPAQRQETTRALLALAEDRPRLLELSWADLIQTLVTEGDEIGLWTPAVRQDLENRVDAARKRANRTWFRPVPPERELPRVLAES
jgi:hypothetical protein